MHDRACGDDLIMGRNVVEIRQEHIYRNGRLLLPLDLAERGPQAQAKWLSSVPMSDRARAFRALPTNVGTAAFLHMEPPARIGLLAGLSRQSIKHLVRLSSDAFVLETLRYAGEDVHNAVVAELPQWRYQRMGVQLIERAAHTKPEQVKQELPRATRGLVRLYRWLRRP